MGQSNLGKIVIVKSILQHIYKKLQIHLYPPKQNILPDLACLVGITSYDPGPTWSGVLPTVEQVTLGARPYILTTRRRVN